MSKHELLFLSQSLPERFCSFTSFCLSTFLDFSLRLLPHESRKQTSLSFEVYMWYYMAVSKGNADTNWTEVCGHEQEIKYCIRSMLNSWYFTQSFADVKCEQLAISPCWCSSSWKRKQHASLRYSLCEAVPPRPGGTHNPLQQAGWKLLYLREKSSWPTGGTHSVAPKTKIITFLPCHIQHVCWSANI